MCIFKMIFGAGFIIGGILVEITWLGICFGTVILGIVLLIFATEILFAPFTIGLAGGLAFFASCEE
jgi:hypothetical protein